MIIGLGYKARSGKDTAAEYLWRHFHFTRTAFADNLKKACMVIFSLTHEQVFGDNKEVEDSRWNDTPRNILQKVGTECLRRGYHQDVWVKSLEMYLKTQSPMTDWVITDVRFPNEAEAIRNWGGVLVRVDRPNAPGIATAKHASETSMETWGGGWDFVLDNSNDLPQLYANIEIMMKELRRSHG